MAEGLKPTVCGGVQIITQLVLAFLFCTGVAQAWLWPRKIL